MDFFRKLKPTDICVELSKINIDKDISEKKRFYTYWINNVLKICGSHYRVEELYDDLKSGIILSDIIFAFTGVKLKMTSEALINNKPVMIINLLLVIQALKKDGIYLMNNNVLDIYDGKPKVILGLVWKMMLHYDFRKGDTQQYYHLESSNSNMLLEPSIKNNFVEGSQGKISLANKFMNVFMGHISSLTKVKDIVKNVVESGQCNKIILTWLKKEICIPYRIKISNFSCDWKDGIAFMALIHRFNPCLVDMEIVRRSHPRSNISRAFMYASQCFGIKNTLNVEDILLESAKDGAVAFYVWQFMRLNGKRVRKNSKGSGKYLTKDKFLSLHSSKSSSQNIHTTALKKNAVKNEDIVEFGTRQFFCQHCHLSTTSDGSCQDMIMNNCNGNSFKPLRNNSCGGYDDYQLECIRGIGGHQILPLVKDDDVFEKTFNLKDIKPKEDDIKIAGNNNLFFSNGLTKLNNCSLENISPPLFDEEGFKECNDCFNLFNGGNTKGYLDKYSSSIGLNTSFYNDNGNFMIYRSNEKANITEPYEEKTTLNSNCNFSNGLQKNNLTSTKLHESSASINMDVVDTVFDLVDNVDLSMKNQWIHGDLPEAEIDNVNVTNDTNIVEESYYEEFTNNFLDFSDKNEINIEDVLSDVKEIENQQTSTFCDSGNNDDSETFSGEENSGLCSMPLFESPFKKVYEMMDDSERKKNIGDYCSISEEAEDFFNTLYNAFSMTRSFLPPSDTIDTLDDLKDQVASMVQEMSSNNETVSDDSTPNYNFTNEESQDQMALSQFYIKTINEQMKEIADIVSSAFTTNIDKSKEMEGLLNLENVQNIFPTQDVESFVSTVTTNDECPDKDKNVSNGLQILGRKSYVKNIEQIIFILLCNFLLFLQ